MMRETTPSIIFELPLVVQPAVERVMLGRFEAARRLFNAALDDDLKRLALDRSRRAMNPGNDHPNGTSKKGGHTWSKSKRYLELAVTRTAEGAGGKLLALNIRRLTMRQYDHGSDSRTKKPLSQRWHRLSDASVIVKRDCYRAFLSIHAKQGGHSPSRLAEGWAVVQPLPERAGLCQLHESTSGLPCDNPTWDIPSESIALERRFVQGLARAAVCRQAQEPGYPSYARRQNPLALSMRWFSLSKYQMLI